MYYRCVQFARNNVTLMISAKVKTLFTHYIRYHHCFVFHPRRAILYFYVDPWFASSRLIGMSPLFQHMLANAVHADDRFRKVAPPPPSLRKFDWAFRDTEMNTAIVEKPISNTWRRCGID
jgi:hypothetical protein